MDELTIVYVWSYRHCKFVPVIAHQTTCPECGSKYPEMHWETVCPGEPFLQCDCGEQFSTIREA